MGKINEQEKIAIDLLSYEDGKEALYNVLIRLCEIESKKKELKEQEEYFNSKKEALYNSVMDKASDEEKEMKKIFSSKMICQENEVLENKVDLGKISTLIKTNEDFKSSFVKVIENKGLSITAGGKLVKQINSAAGRTVVTLDDIQSTVTKKEVVLSPIEEVTETIELE